MGDCRGKAYLFLPLVELSSTHHVTARLKNRKPSTVVKVFRQLWTADPPRAVRIDADGMFKKEFMEAKSSLAIGGEVSRGPGAMAARPN